MLPTVAITSIAHHVPSTRVTNAELAERLDTSDEWIQSRTGIAERRRADKGGTSDLIVPAARSCLEARKIGPEDIDCVIVATSTPDYFLPSTAAVVQRKLEITNAWGFDLSAACSGFIYALVTAAAIVRTGAARRVLLCGADRMSTLSDQTDRGTAVLFGDGAGAVLLEVAEDPAIGIIDHVCRTEPVDERALYVPAGGSAQPASLETVLQRSHYLRQQGPIVFRAAVEGMARVTEQLLERNGLSPNDVHWLVPHQANARIIEAVGRRLGFAESQVAANVDHYGNTNAATIPLCLSEYHERGQLGYGERLFLVGFGAGFTMGAVYLKWSVRAGEPQSARAHDVSPPALSLCELSRRQMPSMA